MVLQWCNNGVTMVLQEQWKCHLNDISRGYLSFAEILNDASTNVMYGGKGKNLGDHFEYVTFVPMNTLIRRLGCAAGPAAGKDSCKAYEVQNEFLTKEILALNELRQHDETRQKILKMNIAKLEAQYYQTRSKYLYLLNEKQVPVRGGEENKSQDVVNQLLQEALETEFSETQEDVTKQAFISSQG
ncbi:TBC1 domain member 2B [Bulinus truncatus]|nr:TBC1 domain member 2B [Bulinus truncatus]